MSVHLCVFLHESKLPTHEQWQSAVHGAGHDLVFDSFSPRQHTGFLPMLLAGEECGFEYSFNALDPNEIQEMRDIVGDRTHVVEFTWHSSMQDMRAAEIAASALTSVANGVFYDPQSGLHAEGRAVFSLLVAEQNAERERKIAQAERKWANVTERRCPECNAPCPEYRENCWVCGFAVGRLPA
jgi:hypothetical protein